MIHLAQLFCREGFCGCSLGKWLQQLSFVVPVPQAAVPVAGSLGKFQAATPKTAGEAAGQQHWDRLDYFLLDFLLGAALLAVS